MTAPKLRDYQEDMVWAAVAEFQKPKQVPFILQAATGAGKSLVIAALCHTINKPVLILQPSAELLKQNYAKMKAFGIEDVQMYSASVGEKKIGKYTMATIGSIYKHPELFEHYEYVLIDECHGVNPKNLSGMLTSFLKAIGAKYVCGLTATPYRMDVTWLRLPGGDFETTAALKMVNRISKTPFFKKIIYKIETKELIERGYLTPIKYYVDEVDWDELVVNSTGADFTEASVEKFASGKVGRISQAIGYSHINQGRTLVFCSTIAQAEAVKEAVENVGITVALVTGKTPAKERAKLVDEFKGGTIRHMLNVGVFTTGFDAPELNTIVMARPTMSLALWYQIVGRGVRLDPSNPDKVLQVYDLAGVTRRLGRVETITVKTEAGGYRDEVWSERGRMDGYPLYTFKVTPKPKEKKARKA